MKKEYDLSTMKSRKNPYTAKLKKPVTIHLSEEVLSYYKQMADESGVPYQSLIDIYLRDFVLHWRKMDILAKQMTLRRCLSLAGKLTPHLGW